MITEEKLLELGFKQESKDYYWMCTKRETFFIVGLFGMFSTIYSYYSPHSLNRLQIRIL